MPAGTSNYAAGTGFDTTAANMPDVSGKSMAGSGDPNAKQDNLLDVHSQGLSAVQQVVGQPGTDFAAAASTGFVRVKNADGTVTWQAAPAGVPATTVAANTTFARASTVGIATPYARQDHDHGMPGPIYDIPFPFATITSPTTGTYKWRVAAPSTLLRVRADLGTVAAAGLDAIFNILVNGTTRIATGKPQITVGQSINTNAATFTSTALATNDLISVNIDQGSDGFQGIVWVTFQENSPVGGAGTPQDAVWGPSDSAFLGQSLDGAGEIGGATILTGGTVYIGAVAVRRSLTISNVWCAVGTAGATLTSNQNFMGLYNSVGTRLAVTADQTTAFGSTGLKSPALTVAQAVGPGIYYVAVLSNGTTPPTLARGVTNLTNLSALHNVGNLATATARFASNATVQTSLPASLTMASNVTTGQVNYWFAIS